MKTILHIVIIGLLYSSLSFDNFKMTDAYGNSVTPYKNLITVPSPPENVKVYWDKDIKLDEKNYFTTLPEDNKEKE